MNSSSLNDWLWRDQCYKCKEELMEGNGVQLEEEDKSESFMELQETTLSLWMEIKVKLFLIVLPSQDL